jgi:hypothetical protein
LSIISIQTMELSLRHHPNTLFSLILEKSE